MGLWYDPLGAFPSGERSFKICTFTNGSKIPSLRLIKWWANKHYLQVHCTIQTIFFRHSLFAKTSFFGGHLFFFIFFPQNMELFLLSSNKWAVMFEKLTPDSLSLLALVFEVSSWVRCFETADSPLHSKKKILEFLYLNTVVLLSYSSSLWHPSALRRGRHSVRLSSNFQLQSKSSVYLELVYRQI